MIALISGQQTDSSARRQLSRLHGLADRLAAADPSSSLPLILSALGGALGAESSCCIHLLEESQLHATADDGPRRAEPQGGLVEAAARGADGGPVGRPLATAAEVVTEADVARASAAWAWWRALRALDARIASFLGGAGDRLHGVAGVISALSRASSATSSRTSWSSVTLLRGLHRQRDRARAAA